MSELSEIYDAAADYIERHGWVQGRLEEDDGRVCALGALFQGAKNLEVSDAAIYHAEKALRSSVRSSVSWWNDDEGRTAQQVIDKFRELAKEHLDDTE